MSRFGSTLLLLALTGGCRLQHGDLDADGDGVIASEDCDDADPTAFPGGIERCDGVDNDCDGRIDDNAEGAAVWHMDADGDGVGDGPGNASCTGLRGQVTASGDCDDANSSIYPGAPEGDCEDPIDYNCDGVVGFIDSDGDGVPACQDCDDTEPMSFPGNAEQCDGLDNNCDGAVDEGVGDTYYADSDGDSYGSAAFPRQACSKPPGYVADATDCDDTQSMVHPGAVEQCDGLDDNCDGVVDNGLDNTYYQDADADGFGAADTAVLACAPPLGFVSDGSDCDDSAPLIYPGAMDVPVDGVDQDCDGSDYEPLVYGVDRFSGEVWALDLANNAVRWTANTGAAAIDLARGPDGTLYVSDYTAGGLFAVSPDGTQVRALTTADLPAVHGVFYDFARDELLLATAIGQVWSVNPSTGVAKRLFSTGALTLGVMRFANDERIWFSRRTTGEIMRWDPGTDTIERVATLPGAEANMLVPTAGGDLRTNSEIPGKLWEIDTRTGRVTELGDLGARSSGLCASPYRADELVIGDHSSRYRLWSAAGGVTDPAPTSIGTPWGCVAELLPDADGDGYLNGLVGGDDCDDWDAAVYPGAPDVGGDGVDSSCDGVDGEDRDGDGDASQATGGRDCDDADPSVFWGTSEACGAPTSCEDLLAFNPYAPTRAYAIDLDGPGAEPVREIYCDMRTDGGGWMLGLVVNTVHDAPIASRDEGWGFGGATMDLHGTAPWSTDPAGASSATGPVAGWLNLNLANYSHLRLAGYRSGVEAYRSDDIARAELRVDFGQDGYLLWKAPADPAREDGQTYTWCGGDRLYVDAGDGQVNRPSGAPADCKGHSALGSGWDFSRSTSTNRGLTLCGADGGASWMYASYGANRVNYPTAGGAQAIWVR